VLPVAKCFGLPRTPILPLVWSVHPGIVGCTLLLTELHSCALTGSKTNSGSSVVNPKNATSKRNPLIRVSQRLSSGLCRGGGRDVIIFTTILAITRSLPRLKTQSKIDPTTIGLTSARTTVDLNVHSLAK
jgi:hypothetical protein